MQYVHIRGIIEPTLKKVAMPLESNDLVQHRNVLRDAPAPLASGVTPVPTSTFVGLSDNNTNIPPDTCGAVSKTHVMTMLNSQVALMDRTGTLIAATTLLGAWWTALPGISGVLNPSVNRFFDPKMTFDPTTEQFIACVLAYDSATTPKTKSNVLFARSSSGDLATATWYGYFYAADATETNWADYPQIGFSKDKFVISYNMFNTTTNLFLQNELLVVDKAAFLGSAPASLSLQTLTVPGGVFTVTPAIIYDGNVATDVPLIANSATLFGVLDIYVLTGAPGSTSVSLVSAMNTGVTWRQTSTLGLPQAWSATAPSQTILANDDRTLCLVQRGTTLYVCQNVFLDASSGHTGPIVTIDVQVVRATVAGTLIDVERLGSTTTTMYAFPCLAVNQYNDMIVGYTSFSTTTYARCAYRNKQFGTSLFGAEQIYPSVAVVGAEYYKTFGGGRNRWGDYSITQVDPLNDTEFWTLQERAIQRVPYPSASAADGSGRWETYWALVGADPHVLCIDGTRLDVYAPGYYRYWENGSDIPEKRIIVNLEVRSDKHGADYAAALWIKAGNDDEQRLLFSDDNVDVDGKQQQYSIACHASGADLTFVLQQAYNTVGLSVRIPKEEKTIFCGGLVTGRIHTLHALDDITPLRNECRDVTLRSALSLHGLVCGSSDPHIVSLFGASVRMAIGDDNICLLALKDGRTLSAETDERGFLRRVWVDGIVDAQWTLDTRNQSASSLAVTTPTKTEHFFGIEAISEVWVGVGVGDIMMRFQPGGVLSLFVSQRDILDKATGHMMEKHTNKSGGGGGSATTDDLYVRFMEPHIIS